MSTTIVTRRARPQRSRVTAVTTAVVPVQHSGTTHRSSRRRRRQKSTTSGKVSPPNPYCNVLAQDYINTLNNPFSHRGLVPGYSSLSPNIPLTAYYRNTINPNADGSFAFVLMPSAADMVYTNVSGNTGTTWTHNGANNLTAIQNFANVGTIVSGGLRVYVTYPATSAPGSLTIGGNPGGLSYVEINSTSPYALGTSPYTESVRGPEGATVLCRPTGPESFLNSNYVTQGYYVTTPTNAQSVNPSFTTPYIVGQGWISGSPTVYVEAILNITAQQTDAVTTSTPVMGSDNVNLSDCFPNPSSLVKYARPRIFPFGHHGFEFTDADRDLEISRYQNRYSLSSMLQTPGNLLRSTNPMNSNYYSWDMLNEYIPGSDTIRSAATLAQLATNTMRILRIPR
jgi:hypothetical protein